MLNLNKIAIHLLVNSFCYELNTVMESLWIYIAAAKSNYLS